MVALLFGVGVALIGLGVAHDLTEDNRTIAKLQQRNKEIEDMIKANNVVKEKYIEIKDTAESAKAYLSSSKKSFTDGGHYLDGEPLANSEFKYTEEQVKTAITNIKNVIVCLETNISALEGEKKLNESKIAELSK